MAVAVLRLLQQEAPDFSPISRSTRPRIVARRRGSRTTKSDMRSRGLDDRGRTACGVQRATISHATRKKIIARKNLRSYFAHRSVDGISLAPRVVEQANATHASQLEILAAHSPRTTNRDWMTRIGFAYNQKPESTVGLVSATTSESRADEEPPSIDDVYAEWDSAETIDAVAVRALRLRRRHPPRGDRRLPRAPPRRAPRHRLQHRRRTPRHESRSPRPGDLRVLRRPVLRQRSVHALALPPQGADEGRPHGPRNSQRAVRAHRIRADARHALSRRPRSRNAVRFPLFLKPVQEGSIQGNHRAQLRPHARRARGAGAFSPRDVRAAGDRRRRSCPARSSPAACSGTARRAACCRSSAINFGSLPDGALPIYGYEAKWIWDTPRDPLDIFECPARIDRAAPVGDRRRRAPRLSRARLPRLVAHRRSPRRGRRSEHRRGESAPGHSAQPAKTTPACPRRRAPRVSTTTS